MLGILKENIPFIIIGNKVDLVKEVSRSIDPKLVKEFAQNYNSIYIETSAKTGENVEDAFRKLTLRMIKYAS